MTTDQRVLRAEQVESRKAMVKKELARQKKETEQIHAHNKWVKETREKAEAEADKLSRMLDPPDPEWQSIVTPRLNEHLTKELGVLIKHVAYNKAKIHFNWLSVTKAVARDVMSRAYPLALQLGIMVLPVDKDMALSFANGSTIEFSWPGKGEKS